MDPSSEISRPAPGAEDKREPWLTETGEVNGANMTQTACSPSWLLERGNEDLRAAGYEATMHIDLLPEYQKGGWGSKLIERFTGAVAARKREGNKGIWIGIGRENGGVVKFYEKVGFKLWEGKNETRTSITMVKDL